MDIPSLFMIPSAVSSGKVHSVFPNSTDADFQFNRDSDATRVNSEGLIERVGYYGSEEVSNGDFSQSGTVTSTSWTLGWQSADTGASISDGLLTIERTTATVRVYATNNVNSFIALTSGKKYKLTYTIVSNSNNALLDYHNGGSYVTAPNSEGTHTIDYTTAGTVFLFRNNTDNSTIKIDNVSIKEVLGDRARLNYEIEGGLVNTKPSLLLEPQSTNLALYSEDVFVYNYNDSTIRENVQIITPYGYKSQAGKIDAEFGVSSPIRAASYSLGTYSTNDVVTLSGFVKYNGYRYVQFGGYFGSESARFDLINGVITQNLSNVISSSMVKFPNDWYKLTVTYTFQNTIGNGRLYAGWVISPESDFSFTNAPSGGIYVWGLQAELGSYATSYIPTNGSTQTRAAETCNGAGTSSILPSEEGILYAELKNIANDGTNKCIAISAGLAVNNRVTIVVGTGDNVIRPHIITNGVAVFDLTTNSFNTVDNFVKIAVRYKTNDFACWVNGTQALTDTSGNVPTGLDTLKFDVGNNTLPFYGKIRDIRVYNTKEMTDSEVDILLTKITS